MGASGVENEPGQRCGACGHVLAESVDTVDVAGRVFHPGCVEAEHVEGLVAKVRARMRRWTDGVGAASGA